MLENSPSLRPILVERDSDHDQRADCDHCRADKRQLSQHADNDRPDAESSLHTREAPACDTHRTSPFGPQHRGATLQREAIPGYSPFGCSLDQGEGTLAIVGHRKWLSILRSFGVMPVASIRALKFFHLRHPRLRSCSSAAASCPAVIHGVTIVWRCKCQFIGAQ